MSNLQDLIDSAITEEKAYRDAETARIEREAKEHLQRKITAWELSIKQEFPRLWQSIKDQAQHVITDHGISTTLDGWTIYVGANSWMLKIPHPNAEPINLSLQMKANDISTLENTLLLEIARYRKAEQNEKEYPF